MHIRFPALSSLPRSSSRSRPARCASRARCTRRYVEPRRRVQTTHRVAGGGAVGGADARVLIRVGGDVGDKFLRCEREETSELRRGLVGAVAGRWKAGEGEVVGCDSVGDLVEQLAKSLTVIDKGTINGWGTTYNRRIIIHLA